MRSVSLIFGSLRRTSFDLRLTSCNSTRLELMKRRDFHPVDLMGCLINPPPFSRGSFFLLGGLLAGLGGLACMNEGKSAQRFARYQEVLSSVTIVHFIAQDVCFGFFSGQDLQSWKKLAFPLSSLMITLDRSDSTSIGLGYAAWLSINRRILPRWILLWRAFFLGYFFFVRNLCHVSHQNSTQTFSIVRI